MGVQYKQGQEAQRDATPPLLFIPCNTYHNSFGAHGGGSSGAELHPHAMIFALYVAL